MPDNFEHPNSLPSGDAKQEKQSKPLRRKRSIAGRATGEEKAIKYKVGFKRPPKEGQFKEGQSGNLKGRPKGTKNKPKIDEGVYHFERAIASGIISLKAPPRPKRSTSEKMFRHRSTAGFPRQEHCFFDDSIEVVTVKGPIDKEEDFEWQKLQSREWRLMNDLIDELQAVRHAADLYIRKEMERAADFTQELLSEVRTEKEKFTRRVHYRDFISCGKSPQKK